MAGKGASTGIHGTGPEGTSETIVLLNSALVKNAPECIAVCFSKCSWRVQHGNKIGGAIKMPTEERQIERNMYLVCVL